MAESSIAGSGVSKTLITVSHVGTLHINVGNAGTVHVGDNHHHHHHHVSESVQDQEEDCDGSTSYREMEVDIIEPIHGAVTTAEGGAGAFEVDREILRCIQNLFANLNKPEEWEKDLNTCTELAARYEHRGRTVQAKVQVNSVRSFDRVMDKIGEALGVNENLMTLGLHLGFTHSMVEMFIATNRAYGNVSSKGTKNMIFAWSNQTPIAKQVEGLREALVKADLKLVAEKHLSI